MRKDYASRPLTRGEMPQDPFILYEKWFKEAVEKESVEPNAMTLATVGSDLMPSVRVVLLKKFSKDGFVFFTNYLSKKGKQLEENPKAALLFFWPGSIRQIRIEGNVKKITEKESDEYFYSRPLESRATAALSIQSAIMEDRESFENNLRTLIETADEIIRPQHWGGYIVEPCSFEFWQGGTNRFHDRFLYSGKSDGWEIMRLYP